MSIHRTLGLLAIFATLAPATPAAVRGDFGMEILVNGRPVRELPHQGRTYIEAMQGKEYAVRLVNRTGERVAVALAVDGLNSIDARRTSAREARKWILGPWETVTIGGWQTSGSTARRFYFTTERDSYGNWLGRTENLGVISAAFFRERPREIVRDQRFSRGAAEGAPPMAKSSVGDEDAATGIGREVDHRVREVAFDAEADPAATIDVRYEYRDSLVRLGVLRREPPCDDRLARRERARGFEEPGFAPDPYRAR